MLRCNMNFALAIQPCIADFRCHLCLSLSQSLVVVLEPRQRASAAGAATFCRLLRPALQRGATRIGQ